MSFNWVDFLMAGILVVTARTGALRGVWLSLIRIAVLLIALVASAIAATPAARFVQSWFPVTVDPAEAVTFFGVFVLVWIAVGLVSRSMFRMLRQHAMAPVNQGLGAIISICGGWLMGGALLWSLSYVPSVDMRESIVKQSFTGRRAIQSMVTVVRAGAELIGQETRWLLLKRS